MLDELTLSLLAGAGGNGVVGFRRERYVPRGGPDGGDGGKGGDIVIEATRSVLVLDRLQRRRNVRGEAGGNGGPNKRHGRNGGDTVLQVPVGTIVWSDDGVQLADLWWDGARAVVALGGSGGKGNARLATSTRRAPRIAERGLPGETRKVRLELRLLAEAGLVGLPNAGKSSFLRAVSQARPRVGAYPFTTLEPYLGIAEIGYETVVIADIPGLIEGAHGGAGLGDRFLQHIQRTRVLIHVVDSAVPEPLQDIETVRRELTAFGQGVDGKEWLVALNKIDLPETAEKSKGLIEKLKRRGVDAYAISALTGAGMDELMKVVFKRVQAVREEEERVPIEPPILQPVANQAIDVVKIRGGFRVRGKRPEEAILRFGVDSEEARAAIARRLRRQGVERALRRAGVSEGDRVRIGKVELQWPL